MARIRTIKPEFPHSESMGRVSRDARLCFVQLWTLADDAGRLRGASRMLASLLFPYDDDAPALIDGWLGELEAENCIARYEVDGGHYIQIRKWLEHQKIDKPSQSKIPPFDEAARTVAKPRECSSGDLDQGPRTKDREGTIDAHGEPDAVLEDAEMLAVASWNAMAEKTWGSRKVQRLTPSRKAKLKARLRECGGIDGWNTAVAKVAASQTLTQGIHGSDGQHWPGADFDFMLQEKSFTKLMEGGYDRAKSNGSKGNGVDHVASRREDIMAGLTRGLGPVHDPSRMGNG